MKRETKQNKKIKKLKKTRWKKRKEKREGRNHLFDDIEQSKIVLSEVEHPLWIAPALSLLDGVDISSNVALTNRMKVSICQEPLIFQFL